MIEILFQILKRLLLIAVLIGGGCAVLVLVFQGSLMYYPRPYPSGVAAIFHGSEDRVIPVAMGRELAEQFPEAVTFSEVTGADHNNVLASARYAIFEALDRELP